MAMAATIAKAGDGLNPGLAAGRGAAPGIVPRTGVGTAPGIVPEEAAVGAPDEPARDGVAIAHGWPERLRFESSGEPATVSCVPGIGSASVITRTSWRALWGRALGSLASNQETMGRASGGKFEKSGGWLRWATSTSWYVVPSNGGLPVSNSKAIMPRA